MPNLTSKELQETIDALRADGASDAEIDAVVQTLSAKPAPKPAPVQAPVVEQAPPAAAVQADLPLNKYPLLSQAVGKAGDIPPAGSPWSPEAFFAARGSTPPTDGPLEAALEGARDAAEILRIAREAGLDVTDGSYF